MPEYDSTHFSPAAPVAVGSVRHAPTGVVFHNVELLMDTGAEVTLLPQAVIEDLGISLDTAPRYELMGFDGTRSSSPAVDLDLLLLGKTFRGRFLVVPDSRGILGREILNHLALLLDGPRREWSEHRA